MKIISLIILISSIVFGFNIQDNKTETVSLFKDSVKILEYSKDIKNITITNSTIIDLNLFKDSKRKIKIIGKKEGNTQLFIKFNDNSFKTTSILVNKNLSLLDEVLKKQNKSINLKQSGDKIVLSGICKDQKEIDNIVELVSKSGIDTDKDLINILKVKNPNKMFKFKLYIVEINKNKGLDLKNNWGLNFTKNQTGDTAIANSDNAVNNIMSSAVSLTSALAASANYLGDKFSVGTVINYMQSKGVAKVLKETEITTTQKDKAILNSGGTIYVKQSTTDGNGAPISDLTPVNYGLTLEIKINKVINDNFIDLTLSAKQSNIDWTNQVDNIPSFTNQEINSNIIIKNKNTIVIGGLKSVETSKTESKVPLLGDIPGIGFFFTSKSNSKVERNLVFFIVPEIIDQVKGD